MPPRDARLCPRLKPALPGDAIDGTGVTVGDSAEVLFGDGLWHVVRIVAEWATAGGWVVQLEWRADGSTWTGEYVYDKDKFRE